VQLLINGLNLRGFRESELSHALKIDLKLYENAIAECPISKLNDSIPSEGRRENVRLVYYKASMSGMSHADKEPDFALKTMFLDHLSSFEEQLFMSGLSFRANSEMTRDEWKSLIQDVNPAKSDFVKKTVEALSRLSSLIPVSHLRDEWQVSKWIECLEDTQSVSRLFFLLSILENKVNYPQNVSGYCRLCRRKKDAENMIFCDSCNRPHHTYCLKLDEVPRGKWFCPKCKQIPKVPKSPRKAPINYNEQDENEDDDEQDDEIEVINSSQSSSQNTTDDDGDEDTEDETGTETDCDENTCAVCNADDDKPDVECPRCNRMYHFSCHIPKVPTDATKWICFKCAPVRGSSSKRKSDEPAASQDDRSKRTRIALRSAVVSQTQTEADKVRTSRRSTRHSDDDGYNHVLCHKILSKLKEQNSGRLFLRRPTSREVSHLSAFTEFMKSNQLFC
jgi:hypothetical protein